MALPPEAPEFECKLRNETSHLRSEAIQPHGKVKKSRAGLGQDDSKLYVCGLLVAPMSTLLWSDSLSRKSPLNNDSCDRFQPSGSALIDVHWQMDRMSISWSVFISILLDGIGIGWSTEVTAKKKKRKWRGEGRANSVLLVWTVCGLRSLLVEFQLTLCESIVYESTAQD